MSTGHELDNPIWHALRGPQAGFAVGHGLARRYVPHFAPFAAIEANTPAAYRDLAEIVPPGERAIVFRPTEEPAIPGWETVNARQLVQMVADIVVPIGAQPHEAPDRLGDGDDMHGLVDRAQPGPFATRTPEMGHYIGYRGENGLRAMGGERFRLPNYVELSAIAVDPSARGLGLGASVVLHLAQHVRAQGKTPFLHVFPENPAMALYHRLGFRERRRLWVIWRRRLPI
jgi:GNAT superfamily N-acetyltransferase